MCSEHMSPPLFCALLHHCLWCLCHLESLMWFNIGFIWYWIGLVLFHTFTLSCYMKTRWDHSLKKFIRQKKVISIAIVPEPENKIILNWSRKKLFVFLCAISRIWLQQSNPYLRITLIYLTDYAWQLFFFFNAIKSKHNVWETKLNFFSCLEERVHKIVSNIMWKIQWLGHFHSLVPNIVKDLEGKTVTFMIDY